LGQRGLFRGQEEGQRGYGIENLKRSRIFPDASLLNSPKIEENQII